MPEPEIQPTNNTAKGRQQMLVLLAVFVLPIAIFFALKLGKQNFKHLPIYGERNWSATTNDTVYHTLPVFELTNQDGKPFTPENLKGKMHVADFFFTKCPGICKELSKNMALIQKEVEYAHQKSGDIQLVSYSIDPKRASVAVLKAYAKRHDAIAGLWIFVTGNRATTFNLLQKGYLVPVDDNVKDGEGGFFHSNFFILVDPDLRIRGIYDGLQEQERKRLLDEIKVLRLEYLDKGVFKQK